MRIANNVMAMNTHRFYTSNNATVSKSAEKLSSGYRVNRAGDDAAGLAISEKMRAQVRGMNMASKNSQDAVSLVQTAEGALQEVHSMLQRMNEMAVQSANGTNQDLDRQALNLEFTNLKAEIDQVATTTNFNERTLLSGDLGKGITVGVTNGGSYTAGTTNVTALAVALDDAAMQTALKGTAVGAAGPHEVTFGVNAENSNRIDMIIGGNVVATSNADVDTIAGHSTPNTQDLTFETADGTALGTMTLTGSGAGTNVSVAGAIAAATSATGRSITVTEATTSALTLQVGATASETLGVSVGKINSEGLFLSNAKIDSQSTASAAIKSTRNAINAVSTQRATLGALQNRLEHKIANLDNTSENLSAAESRIRDVDMAKEMTAFTKNNILSQAATAMLAQANSSPQNVLSLLR